jgi:hypothetical protein
MSCTLRVFSGDFLPFDVKVNGVDVGIELFSEPFFQEGSKDGLSTDF